MQFGKEQLPEFKEITSIDWVLFGDEEGWKNQYPQYIDMLSKTSPKNGAILKAKNRYVYGYGLVPKRDGLDLHQNIALASFLRKIKDSRVIKKIVNDFNKYGGFCAEMIPNGNGIIEPHYLPFKNVRVSKKEYGGKEDKELQPRQYYYTSDWSKSGKQPSRNKDFEVFERFEWDISEMKADTRYIVYYNEDETEDYPIPDYSGGVSYVDADSEVGNFVKNNTKNGFTGGYLVNFYNGDPTPEQRREINENFDTVLHGTSNAGKSLKSFNEQDSKGIEVTPLNTNGQDDRFINLNKQIRDEIFTAHCTPISAVEMPPDASGLSNNADQDRVAIAKWQEGWIKPQQAVIEDFVNAILETNEIQGKAEIKEIEPIKAKLSEQTIKEISTPDELRKMAGLPKSDIQTNPIATALASLSPLVANKILESMSLSEIRSIVDLTTTDEGVITGEKTLLSKFSKEDDQTLVDLFSACGVEDSGDVIQSAELFATDIFDARKQAETMALNFATKLEDSILSVLNDKPELTNKQIADLLNEKESTVKGAVKKLQNDGALDGREPVTEDTAEPRIIAVYKYAKRKDVPELEPGGESRPFCVQLVGLSQSRSWSIEDIQNISNQVGYDVFSRRGGFYHNPKTGRTTPYCRHVWEVRLVRI